MLSIREKISFGVLLALFIVPEIICGAIRSNLFMLYCYNVLHKGSNVCLPNNGADIQFDSNVLLVQFGSIFFAFLFIIWKRKKILNKTFFWTAIPILFILLVLSGLPCLVDYAMTHATVNLEL